MDDTFESRLKAEQLRMVAVQIGRLPVALLVINLFIAWLVGRAGWPAAAAVWFVLAGAFEIWRYRLCQHERRNPTRHAALRLQVLSHAFIAAACLRVALVPLVFSQDEINLQVMLTMVYVGLAAGGVATVGGVYWAYTSWASIVGGGVALAWVLQGGFDGYCIGVLTATLFATLALFARDEGRNLRKLLLLAYENETLAGSLRVERDRAESASRSKTRFFASASHDLRQPLHALSINATTLELVARTQSDPMIRELSKSIMRALRQSNDLLDALLDISQLDAQVVEIRIEPVDAGTLVQRMRDEFAPTAAQRGLALCTEVPSEPVWLLSDHKQLRRMIGNLVSNSLKFTTVGKVVIKLVSPPTEAGARFATIAIVDTGPGIPHEEQERVFEDFYQLGNPSRDRSHGLGLGLSIVKRTAVLLGASVSVQSEPGHGCCFELRLPVAEVPGNVAPHVDSGGTPDFADGIPSLGLRVLAIDDEEEILVSLTTLLPHFGCEVRGAGSLASARIVIAQGFKPQLLLVDHRLKDETGADAVAALQELLGPIPVVIVTGDTSPSDLRSALDAGTIVVHKPIDGRLLAGAMAEAMTKAG